MPFKVVQTNEKGQLKLSAVPDQWEHNNILFWPKKSAEKLRRQENCPPSISWDTIPCHVKRTNLRTFQDAENEIDAMSDKSETETDNECYLQTNRSLRKKNSLLPAKSFNDEAKALVENRDKDRISTTSTISQELHCTPTANVTQTLQIPAAIQQKQNTTVSQELNYTLTTSAGQTQQNSSTIQPEINSKDANYSSLSPTPCFVSQDPQLETTVTELPNVSLNDHGIVILNADGQIQQLQIDVKSIKGDINTILLNQNALYEIQTNMSSKLSEIENQLSSYIQMIASKKQENPEVDLIKTLRELEEFEKKLADREFIEQIKMKLAVVCTKGLGKGGANAYYLIDSIFDRNFLKECTWTGLAKDETTKICFKAFKKTISLFFDIVHATDSTFTKKDCEKFFKTILKNARKRSESSQRMSAPKVRTIKKRTKKSLPAVDREIVNEELPDQINPTLLIQQEIVIEETPDQIDPIVPI